MILRGLRGLFLGRPIRARKSFVSISHTIIRSKRLQSADKAFSFDSVVCSSKFAVCGTCTTYLRAEGHVNLCMNDCFAGGTRKDDDAQESDGRDWERAINRAGVRHDVGC